MNWPGGKVSAKENGSAGLIKILLEKCLVFWEKEFQYTKWRDKGRQDDKPRCLKGMKFRGNGQQIAS